MGWFSDALTQAKQAAEQAAEQAKQAAEQVAAQAKDLGDKVNEAVKTSDMDLVRGAFALDQEYCVKEAAQEGKAAWDVVPAAWKGRSREWSILTKGIIDDPNTFLVGPMDRTEPLAIAWTCDPVSDEEQIACAKHQAMLDMHSSLAPRLIPDEKFWLNYYWTVRNLATCKDAEEVAFKLQHLNVDPTQPPLPVGETQRGRGVTHEKAKNPIAAVLKRVEAQRAATKRIAQLVAAMEDEVKTSEEDACLLTRIINRGGNSTDLRDSVYESCKYHKEKVTKLLQQAAGEGEDDRADLPLDALRAALEALDKAIALQSGEAPAPAPAPTEKAVPPAAESSTSATVAPPASIPPPPAAAPSAAAAHVDPTSPKPFDDPFGDDDSLGFTPPDGSILPAAGTDGDDGFGGALPWEDEDETATPEGTKPPSGDSWIEADPVPSPGQSPS